METYIEFLERHLGEIEYGWSKDENGNVLPFQTIRFKGGPFPGTVTYSTLGLSNQGLTSKVSGKLIRQELFFVSYSSFGDRNIPGILQRAGKVACESKHAYLRGEVVGPYGPLFDDLEMEGLYVSSPVYFEDSFGQFDLDENISYIQSWVFPITKKEAIYIKQNGWDRFEDMLEGINPDLIDFTRASII